MTDTTQLERAHKLLFDLEEPIADLQTYSYSVLGIAKTLTPGKEHQGIMLQEMFSELIVVYNDIYTKWLEVMDVTLSPEARARKQEYRARLAAAKGEKVDIDNTGNGIADNPPPPADLAKLSLLNLACRFIEGTEAVVDDADEADHYERLGWIEHAIVHRPGMTLQDVLCKLDTLEEKLKGMHAILDDDPTFELLGSAQTDLLVLSGAATRGEATA